MPRPLSQNRRVDRPLQNVLIARMQEESAFFGPTAAPFLEVENKSDKYFILSPGEYNIRRMQPRASGTRSESAGWALSSGSYECYRKAINHPDDWYDLADEDPVLQSDVEAAEFLKNQALMEHDSQVAAVCMLAGSWTQDYDWDTTSTTLGTDFLEWSSSGSAPQSDVQYIKDQMHGKIFKYPNTMIVGPNIHKTLITHSEVRSALQYTRPTTLAEVNDRGLMASYFGIENYHVALGRENSSNVTGTASYDLFVDEDDVWIGYVSPNAGRKTLSAMYTFAWKAGGDAKNGVVTRRWEDEARTANFMEVESFWSVKQIAADAGCFIDGSTHS